MYVFLSLFFCQGSIIDASIEPIAPPFGLSAAQWVEQLATELAQSPHFNTVLCTCYDLHTQS